MRARSRKSQCPLYRTAVYVRSRACTCAPKYVSGEPLASRSADAVTSVGASQNKSSEEDGQRRFRLTRTASLCYRGPICWRNRMARLDGKHLRRPNTVQSGGAVQSRADVLCMSASARGGATRTPVRVSTMDLYVLLSATSTSGPDESRKCTRGAYTVLEDVRMRFH